MNSKVVLSPTSLLHLTEIERTALQKVALARLQTMNLGVAITIPKGKNTIPKGKNTMPEGNVTIPNLGKRYHS